MWNVPAANCQNCFHDWFTWKIFVLGKYMNRHCDRVPTTCILGHTMYRMTVNVHTNTALAHLLVKYKQIMGTQQVWTSQANKRRGITSTCVTLWPTDSRWETNKWPAPAQTDSSHDVASIHKRQMSVRNTRA